MNLGQESVLTVKSHTNPVIARTAQSVGHSFTSFGELAWSKGGPIVGHVLQQCVLLVMW